MTPWTKLLEALHSSLIDEVNEALPDEKPELGLPRRLEEWRLPDPEITEVAIAVVEFDRAGTGGTASRGLVALGMSRTAINRLGLDPAAFWQRLLKRAATEFVRRGIRPRLQFPTKLDGAGDPSLPSGVPNPGRLVWIPLRLSNDGRICLGLGA